MTPTPTPAPATGGCLCGGVKYRVNGPLRDIIYCHCSQCRRTSGHYVAATAVDPAHLELIVDAQLRWYRSSDSASRGFCQRCGGNLFWRPHDQREHLSIFAGTLDLPTGLKAVEHIFVTDAGDYYTLDDGLPQYLQDEDSVRWRPNNSNG